MDKQKIDAAAKIIDPESFAQWDKGDSFDRLQVVMRMKAAREKAAAIAAVFGHQRRRLDPAESLGALTVKVDQPISDRNSDRQ